MARKQSELKKWRKILKIWSKTIKIVFVTTKTSCLFIWCIYKFNGNTKKNLNIEWKRKRAQNGEIANLKISFVATPYETCSLVLIEFNA